MPTALRRSLITVLILITGAAVAWRLTLGTTERLGALAEADAAAGDPARVAQAEHAAATGTGQYDYSRIVELLRGCDAAADQKLRRYAHREFNRSIDYAKAHVYSFAHRGVRYLGVSDEPNEHSAVQLPLQGRYTVLGYVRYATQAFAAGVDYDHSSYSCEVEFDDGGEFDIQELEFSVVR